MQTLSVHDGVLFLGAEILLCRYEAGDCDTIHWPLRRVEYEGWTLDDAANLRTALYDAYEMGQLTERSVLLPDGQRFDIDGEE